MRLGKAPDVKAFMTERVKQRKETMAKGKFSVSSSSGVELIGNLGARIEMQVTKMIGYLRRAGSENPPLPRISHQPGLEDEGSPECLGRVRRAKRLNRDIQEEIGIVRGHAVSENAPEQAAIRLQPPIRRRNG
jgi:hypothetical protein